MTEERKQDFDSAARAFLMAADVQEDGYEWAIRGAECLHKDGKVDQASKVLEAVIEQTGTSQEYAEIKQKAIIAQRLLRSGR